MKKINYSILLAFASLAGLVSCQKNLDKVITEVTENMISFSVGDEQATKAGFYASTNIAMRIQSDEKVSSGTAGVRYTRTTATAGADGTQDATSYSEVSFTTDQVRYWDDAFGRFGQLSVYAVAVPNAAATLTNNGTTLENLLTKGDDSATWGSNATNTIAWKVTTTEQTMDASDQTVPTKTIGMEDLTYSNNIQANATLGKDGVYRWKYTGTTPGYSPTATGAATHNNGRMVFYQQAMTFDNPTEMPTDAPGHFDKGHLKFKHALSRLTVKLVEGAGFGTFDFASGTNIKLLGMNTSGTLDIKTGVWTPSSTTTTIDKMAKTADGTKPAAGTYVAQMLPLYTFTDGNNTNVMEFTIDNNTYYVTQDMIFDALKANNTSFTSPITMEQGKNYVLTITVNKTKIDAITATLVPWDDVTGSFAMNNAHITVTTANLYDGSTFKACEDLYLLRKGQDLGSIVTGTPSPAPREFSGTYGEGHQLTEHTDRVWKTNWYFENNKTAYHIRSINTKAKSSFTGNSSDKFSMENGAQSTNDYHWGAPLKSTVTSASTDFKYNNGYSDLIADGITATESQINLTEFHMMSNINVILRTTTGTDAVQLKNGSTAAKVYVTRVYPSANVDMGIGKVTVTGTITGADGTQITTPADATDWTVADGTGYIKTKNPYTYAVVPQELKRGTEDVEANYVGFTIVTPDDNKYYVIKQLPTITASTVGTSHNQTQGQAIKQWYPNHSYTYTFTLTKTEIKSITCTVAAWSDVVAADKNVGLED